MGYESKIYIVEKSDMFNEETKLFFGEVLATMDMSKMDIEFRKLFKNQTQCYIFADDGNTIITKDMYNSPLWEAELSEVIVYLENEIEKGDEYRRLPILLDILRTFRDHQHKFKDIRIIHYGH